jgi:hypothetical protein
MLILLSELWVQIAGEIISFSLNCPYSLWGPPSLLHSGWEEFFPRDKVAGV